MYRFLFICFLWAIIFLGSIYVGPATPRQYMAIVMTVACILNSRYLRHHNHRLILLYIVFLFFHGLSSCLEGSTASFFRDVISKYLVAIVAYYATVIYYRKYATFRDPVNAILLFGVVNAVVTILQFIGNPIGIGAGYVFLDTSNEVKFYQFQHMLDGGGYALFGILGDPVLNGYVSLLMPLLTLDKIYCAGKTVNKKYRQGGFWLMWVLFMFSLFTVQERSAFFIAGAFSMLYFFHESKLRLSTLFLALIIALAVILFLPHLLNSDIVVNSRFADQGEDVRVGIYSRSGEFIIQHLLFGGKESAINYIDTMPHDFILNSFIYGGLFGGLIVLYIILKQFLVSYRLYRKDFEIGIVLCFVGYTLNGLAHNPSIVTGDVLIWMLWAMVYMNNINLKSDGTAKAKYRA